MLNLLRCTYYLASAISLVAGLAVTASMFIADRAPQSMQYWIITIAISLLFALAGLLLFGVARQLIAMGVLTRAMASEEGATLRTRWSRLAAYLLIGGMVLLMVLLLVTYAIVARIGQGFAVFG